MKMVIFAALLALFLSISPEADASFNCSVGVGNGIGDIISGTIRIFFKDSNGYAWNVYDAGGNTVSWSNSTQTDEHSVSFDWTYTATQPFETFTGRSGSTADTCDLVITGVIAANHEAPSSYSKSTKDTAAFWSSVAQQASLAFLGCSSVMDMTGYPFLGRVCGAAAVGAALGQAYADHINHDPYDPNYYSTYEPSYQDAQSLGGQDCSGIDDGTLQWLCNSLNDTIVQLAAMADGANGSNDRYISSCQDGNCIEDRKWEALWYGQHHGQSLSDLAYYGGYVSAWYCGQVGCDQYWIDLFNAQGDSLSNIASEEQGMQ
jgi:hypothetical protein